MHPSSRQLINITGVIGPEVHVHMGIQHRSGLSKAMPSTQESFPTPQFKSINVRLAHWLPEKIAERYERYDPQRPIDNNCHLLGATESLWEGQSCE